MENQLPAKLPSSSEISTLMPNTVLREQPKSEAAKHISALLDRLARLYQVPNWDEMNAILLTEWTMDNYPAEMMETITRALTRPKGETKVWRLTPDTIGEWMAFQLEKEAAEREKEVHNNKNATIEIQWPDERLAEWEDLINNSTGFKPGAKLTEEEIARDGREKPQKEVPAIPLNDLDAYLVKLALQYDVGVSVIKEVRRRWMVECYELTTGHKKSNWISFDEWLLK